jgi:hypothetical protein
MKRQSPAWLAGSLALVMSAVLGAHGQGTFQNLDFESARIILDQSSAFYPYAANATNAFPGWRVSPPVSGVDVLYNTLSLGAAAVSIHDAGDSMIPPIAGQYSVTLQGADQTAGSAWIAQTGLVPASAQSLTFWGQLGSLQITFNSQLLPYFATGSGPSHLIYGADISAFAGQSGELRFSAAPNTGGSFDNIQFSNQAVPEPGLFALSALGALLLGCRVLRPRR